MRKNRPIQISPSVLHQLHEYATAAAPHECCGLLLGEDGAITSALAAANVAADPLSHFEIDPHTLIAAHRAARAGGPPIAGYYHSHPAGVATPSATDRAMAAGDGMIWAIVAGGDITFWRNDETGFAPLAAVMLTG